MIGLSKVAAADSLSAGVDNFARRRLDFLADDFSDVVGLAVVAKMCRAPSERALPDPV